MSTRQIGQHSSRAAHAPQQQTWPHGTSATSLGASSHTTHPSHVGGSYTGAAYTIGGGSGAAYTMAGGGLGGAGGGSGGDGSPKSKRARRS